MPIRLPILELLVGMTTSFGLGGFTFHNVDSKTTGNHKPMEFIADSQVQRGISRKFIAIRKRDWMVISYIENFNFFILRRAKQHDIAYDTYIYACRELCKKTPEYITRGVQ